ncbi:hypothetical protein [Paenibacillus ferrarius]|uniref:hypothetical protein n=1 Tax=Paenibacillus ferrarius TaxID=1469647 RepID=UPI003D2AF315
MRFTVQYIQLDKIKPGIASVMTSHIRKLRHLMWDCMHLLVVRKNRKDGTYTVVLGQERYDYLRKHTKKRTAPCLVDESRSSAQASRWLTRLRSRSARQAFPVIDRSRLTPAAWSIIRSFLREDKARLTQLSRKQQAQVFALAFRYRRTVIAAMKAKVDEIAKKDDE